ncbi:MAG: SulP family inorganic anion transporter [Chloroflexota bacterium]|nr:SulP family inorganic anion transporter [Chloroflexota bacterium]MDE2941518.1 SulP family inorganic anion transporter [Chloroflexota bacterium]MDE3267737.1 SulP family inorganic anion transporter [Chloroflexota bacterium]
MLNRISTLYPNFEARSLLGDILGGITAAVVGLPVALAFGVAAGLGPAAGVYGAISVGFFAAVFGGTRALISGPTGSMTVAMAVIVAAHADNIAEAFTIVIMAGLIQMVFGLLRLGRYVTYTPYSVISGFMTGVGIIIILVQTLPFLGAPVATGGPIGAIRNFPSIIEHFEANAVGVAGITLAVAILWPRKLDRYLPSSLVALGAGTVVSLMWLTNAPTIGAVPTAFPSFKMPDISFNVLVSSIEPALVIALVGSADTLLTGLVADSMTRTRHEPSKELLAQGMGAVFTGFIQGLPGAGATPSTVANFRAGGRTFVSGVVAVVILVAMVLALGDYVAAIPNALLAGILFKVALDTIDWRFVTRLHRVQREHMAVMLLTLGLTVFLDLVTAVAVGMIAAAVTHARQFELLELDSVVSVPILDRDFFGSKGSQDEIDDFTARVGLVALRGAFTVASSSKLLETIGEDIREHEVVILDFTDTVYVDDSAALVVEQLIETATSYDTHCIVMGLGGSSVHNIQALNVLRRVPSNQIVGSWEEAREVATSLLAH